MLGPEDLVLSSGVIGNPAAPELVRAAQAGGYRGLALWPGAYRDANWNEMRSRFDDAGLVVQDLDAIVVWAGPDDPGGPYYEEAIEHEVYAMADVLRPRGVNVLLHGSGDLSEQLAAEAFAGVCDRAAEHDLIAHLEFSRTRTPADIPSAARVVEFAGRSNGGLMVDAWHVHWGASSFDALRGVPGERVTGVQLCDAPETEPAEFGWATRHARKLPGTGSAELHVMLEALRSIGCRAPICIEAFDTARVEEIGAVAFAHEMSDATRRLFSQPT